MEAFQTGMRLIIILAPTQNHSLALKLYFRYLLCYWLILLPKTEFCQIKTQPVAKFSFTDGSDEDEITKQKAKLVGVGLTDDRFGNSRNEINLFGHEHSYINLGTSPLLKPKAGSISMWIKLTREIFHGEGYKFNPIIITKIAPRDDFYEAYAIYYDQLTGSLTANCSNDSSTSTNVYEMSNFRFLTWYHLVMTYDNHHLSLYVNGKHAGTGLKKYETKFNPLDSVMVGGTGNKKNNRFCSGSFDDIEFYDTVLTEPEIEALYHAPNPNKIKIALNWLSLLLAAAGGITAIWLFIKYRFSLVLKREKQRLELANKLLENDLRINRALMNPHFVFNALNTLHSYILTDNKDIASDYLIKFSRLIRKILDSNMADTLSLELEIELINRYLEMEALRFKNPIKYEVTVENIIPSTVTIPIMMVQPFVENAIWHGLVDKTGEKTVTVSFSAVESDYVKCIIEDNGTGRKLKEDNPEKKSLATRFVEQRLELLNKIHNLSCTLEIIDKPGGTGTIVVLLLPILNK